MIHPNGSVARKDEHGWALPYGPSDDPYADIRDQFDALPYSEAPVNGFNWRRPMILLTGGLLFLGGLGGAYAGGLFGGDDSDLSVGGQTPFVIQDILPAPVDGGSNIQPEQPMTGVTEPVASNNATGSNSAPAPVATTQSSAPAPQGGLLSGVHVLGTRVKLDRPGHS
jgi:hypothetical protein